MLRYVISSLRTKKTISILFSLAICIAMSISMVAINISQQIQEGFYRVDKKYDMILGPVGSHTQLVMSSLFFSDNPLGTISTEYEAILQERYNVDTIVPLAMADSYNGYPIIGTTQQLLEGYVLKEGRLFEEAFEIVVGSNVAQRYNLTIGDELVTSHGTGALAENHTESPYRLVGILEETHSAYDNTCFTTVQSVWNAHGDEEHDSEVHEYDEDYDHNEAHDHEHTGGYTALLVKTGNLAVASQLQTDFEKDVHIQVVQTTKVLRELVSNIDMSKQIALLLCTIIVILAVILTCIMSFLMMGNLQKDIQLLTFLAMKKRKIYNYVLSQVVALVMVSTLAVGGIHHFVLLLLGFKGSIA